jgi:hypothetical protein
MELINSKRLMYSASYVTTQFTPDVSRCACVTCPFRQALHSRRPHVQR